jgi:hypothetical protein
MEIEQEDITYSGTRVAISRELSVEMVDHETGLAEGVPTFDGDVRLSIDALAQTANDIIFHRVELDVAHLISGLVGSRRRRGFHGIVRRPKNVQGWMRNKMNEKWHSIARRIGERIRES